MTSPTNIHFVTAAPAAEPDQTARLLPRLRTLTNDPAREYAQRPGEVQRLPDSIAAMILCKKGYSKVRRNGIVVDGVTRKPLRFWSENSVTIETKAGTNEKVLWMLNRLQPDVIHIMTPDGKYVETIPLDEKPEWFDAAAMNKVLGAKRRSQNRIISRVQALHAPDTEAAVDAATANEAAMKSAVHTFPHDDHKAQPRGKARSIDPETVRDPFHERQRSNTSRSDNPETVELPSSAGGRTRSPARAPISARPASGFPNADRIHEIQRELQSSRTAHADRVQTLARRVAAVTEEDLDDLTNDDGLEPVAALTATGCSSEEEDASDCIL